MYHINFSDSMIQRTKLQDYFQVMNGDVFVFVKYAIKLCHFIGNAIYSHDHVFICLMFSRRASFYKDQLAFLSILFVGLSLSTMYEALPA